MSATPPDRLSIYPDSPFYDHEALGRGIGVRFNGQEKTNVEEYCLSEGWVRVAAGRSLDRHGRPMTLKLKGPVEVWFQDTVESANGQSDGGEKSAATDAGASGGHS